MRGAGVGVRKGVGERDERERGLRALCRWRGGRWRLLATKVRESGRPRRLFIEPVAPPAGTWGMRNRSVSSRETVCSRREGSGSLPCQCHHMWSALSACATTWIHRLDISSSARCIPAQRHAPWTGGGSSTACGRRGWFPAARPPHPSDPAFWGAGASARHRGRVRSMLGCPFAAADNNVSQGPAQHKGTRNRAPGGCCQGETTSVHPLGRPRITRLR